MLQSYKELIVWQKSIDLVRVVYFLTSTFPKEETYDLSSQMRRAAVSIPSNIAEGQRRKDVPEYLQFLRIADASSAELETQIIISKSLYPNLNYSQAESLLEEIQKMLNVLIRNLKPKTYNLKAQNGFTLIELLVVISLGITVAAVGFISLAKYRSSNEMKITLEEVFTATRSMQKRSVSQQDGKRWGVHFSASSTNVSNYTTFSGTSYAGGTTELTYGLKRNLYFSNPFTSSTYDMIFTPIAGKPSENKVISIVSTRKDGIVGDLIARTSGQIIQRKETGMASYWHFDEGTATTTYDASGLQNTGSSTAVTWASGANCRAGGCIDFNGTSDYVKIGDTQNLGSVYSFVFWAKMDNTSAMQFILNKDDVSANREFTLAINLTAGKISFYGFKSDGNFYRYDATGNFDTSWHHWAIIGSGSAINMYKDGVALSTSLVSGTYGSLADTSSILDIGRRSYDGYYFNGTLDEIRVYNKALSAAEVLNLYNDLK